MQNKISDLNNHLFAQLERLNDEDLTGDDLKQEIARAKAIAGVATQIVNGNKVMVEAMKVIKKEGGEITEFPLIFGSEQKKISNK